MTNNENLEKPELTKDEFIKIASHELRTPLTTIKAYIQILDSYIADNGENPMKEYITRTNDYIDKLDGLIANLLDVSKFQAGKIQYNLSQFSFDNLIEETIQAVQPTTHTHKILLTGKTGKTIIGDRYRLEQAIGNVISNAVKYSPNANKVRVALAKTKDGQSVVTAITDFGIGIPKDQLNRIFERYYRVEPKGSNFSGLGIGLYLTNEVVKRHKGKIWLRSREGRGSTFYFSLPIHKEL